jgi:CTP:molybdopterin cytidylyltransferase MocA
MEATKQLLPWPPPPSPSATERLSRTVVEASFDILRPFCARIVIVLDHEADAIRRALGDRPYTAVDGDGSAPMFESIRLGIRAATDIDPAATALLHPADHPSVAPATVQHLLEEATRRPDRAIVPVHDDRGGHAPSSTSTDTAACAPSGDPTRTPVIGCPSMTRP